MLLFHFIFYFENLTLVEFTQLLMNSCIGSNHQIEIFVKYCLPEWKRWIKLSWLCLYSNDMQHVEVFWSANAFPLDLPSRNQWSIGHWKLYCVFAFTLQSKQFLLSSSKVEIILVSIQRCANEAFSHNLLWIWLIPSIIVCGNEMLPSEINFVYWEPLFHHHSTCCIWKRNSLSKWLQFRLTIES